MRRQWAWWRCRCKGGCGISEVSGKRVKGCEKWETWETRGENVRDARAVHVETLY